MKATYLRSSVYSMRSHENTGSPFWPRDLCPRGTSRAWIDTSRYATRHGVCCIPGFLAALEFDFLLLFSLLLAVDRISVHLGWQCYWFGLSSSSFSFIYPFAWSKREIWWPSSKRDHWGPYCTALNNNNDKSFYTRRDSSDIEFQYHYDFISVSATCEHGCKQENEKVSPGLSSKRGKCQGSLSLMALIHPSAILKPERGPVSRCSGYRNIDYDLCIYITRFYWVWNSLAFPTFMFKEELRLKRLQ